MAQADNESSKVAAEGDTRSSPMRRRRRWLRPVLLALGPIAVALVGGYIYMNTGRYAETDNAYVKADAVIISAEVAGPIVEVAVHENQPVKTGDVLFRIDDAPYRVAVDRMGSQLEAVRSFISGLAASYQQRLEELKLAQTNVAYARHELEREQSLADRQLGSEIDLDRARHELDVAEQQIPIIEQALAQLRAQLGEAIAGTVEGHAAFRTVRSMLDDAHLDLKRTVVRAPIDGIASRVPAAGRYVGAGGPVMTIVSNHDIWVEANFKETELTHVAAGQSVVATLDAYPDHEWHGTVESISQATGAEFSVIPAQNASGNWVKVAQRIPVRIALDIASGDPPLRAGMSVVVRVDTEWTRPAPKYLGFLASLRTAR